MDPIPGGSLDRGARVEGDGVRFSVWAPNAERVAVRLVDGETIRAEHVLERGADGIFTGFAAGAGAGTDYFYVLDGRRARPDPVSRHQPFGVHGPSRVVDPDDFHWTDERWRGLELGDLVLYELHVGTFDEAGTFDAVVPHLESLRDLGVTAVELMPVAEFPGSRNWGYDGAHPYAPQSTYGGPEGLRRLVDHAHRVGLGVFLDVVYNHLGPEGNYLREFGPYFTERYRTPWGDAVDYDGPESDEVRRYFVENARYWVSEFHVDGLRLDAVHGIFDFSADHVLAELARAVHADGHRLGRKVLVVAESDLNDPKLVRCAECGGFGLDAQWNDDFHHAVHVALTGERNGYYEDFATPGAVAEVLRRRFLLRGNRSKFRRRRHGAPADDVPADRFVVFTQNHDQIGNRARGERLASLVSFEAQKLSAALLSLAPYVPLLFMGQEYGETRPFLYFVSHGDPALVEAVRAGRRREFASFSWQGEVPDPQAVETFLRSCIDRSVLREPAHAQILRLHEDLLRLRREERILWADGVTVEISGGGAEWVAIRRELGGHGLLAFFNLANERSVVNLPSEKSGEWRLVLATDDERYGGSRGAGTPPADELPALTALVYRRLGNP
jgi:maltooligosyltrehalose trehalohydrolase